MRQVSKNHSCFKRKVSPKRGVEPAPLRLPAERLTIRPSRLTGFLTVRNLCTVHAARPSRYSLLSGQAGSHCHRLSGCQKTMHGTCIWPQLEALPPGQAGSHCHRLSDCQKTMHGTCSWPQLDALPPGQAGSHCHRLSDCQKTMHGTCIYTQLDALLSGQAGSPAF